MFPGFSRIRELLREAVLTLDVPKAESALDEIPAEMRHHDQVYIQCLAIVENSLQPVRRSSYNQTGC